MFGRMCSGRLAHPRAVFVGLHPMRDALLVARTAALEHARELVPVDAAEPVVTGRRHRASRSGSGSESPSTSACGTVMSTNFCRSSSLENRLMPHAIDCALFGDWSSGGPNIISDGHHQRLTASCAIACCSGVPFDNVSNRSKPCR